METRAKIAAELLKDCPAESLEDHQKIAAAIKRGDSRDEILSMPETDHWPETYFWLANVADLKNPAAVSLGRKGGSAKTAAKAKSSAANGAKGGRPRASELVNSIRQGYDWMLVVAHDCSLGERGTVVSRHKSAAGARQAARRSGYDSFLAIKNTADMLLYAPE